MNEDPIISGAWIKAALVLLVGGALGVGAYLLVSGTDINIDLPDIEEVGSDGTTNLSDTTLENTTIGDEPQPKLTTNPFSTASFSTALGMVEGAAGPNREATRVTVNDTQTQFSLRQGDGIEVYSVRVDTGELVRQDATVSISGNATLADFAFPLGAIDPGAVDRMLASAAAMSGASDFAPQVLTLERQIPAGQRKLAWTISAQGADRNLTYRANADGTEVENVGGKGSPIPPELQAAQELNKCIQAANNDIDEITACFDKFSP